MSRRFRYLVTVRGVGRKVKYHRFRTKREAESFAKKVKKASIPGLFHFTAKVEKLKKGEY